MKIKTQVIISIVIFVIALLIIAASVVTTNQRVDHLNKQVELANKIDVGASELGYLSNDYLLFHESQQLDVWNTKYASFSGDISNLTVDTPEQQAVLDNIKASQLRLKSVFNDVVSNLNSTNNGQNSATDPEIIQISWSRLGVQTQSIVFDSSRLSMMLQDELNQVKQTNSLLISTLLGVFILFLLVDYILIYGGIVKSLSDLQAGTRTIGSGNFDVSLKVKKDEIGELAHSFNQMTDRLKTVTASKMDLEREILERKRAEEAHSQLASIVESSSDAIISKTLDGIITSWNKGAEQVYGYRLDEVIGKPVSILAPRDLPDEIPNILEKIRRGEDVVYHDTKRVRKDGKVIDVSLTVSPIKDITGHKVGAATIARDITDRKQAEEKISHLASFPALNPNPVIETDFDGNPSYVNPSTRAIFPGMAEKGAGHPILAGLKDVADELVAQKKSYIVREVAVGGSYFQETVHKVPDKMALRVYALDITNGKRAEMAREQLLIQLNAKTREMENANEELQVKSEELIAQSEEIQCTNEELRCNNDELQRVTRSLRETRDYLEKLINYANAPIIVWDPKSTITRFNHAFERLSGFTANEIIGKDLSILFPPDSRDDSLENIMKTLAGEQWESVEIPILHKSGGISIVLWNSANIYDEDNSLLATIAQGQDITKRKQAEKGLEEAKFQAELYLDLMGHDISNMHQIIMAQLELSEEILKIEGRLEGEDKELIDSSISTLERAARLIDNVRKLQKLRAGEYGLEAVDLSVILKEVLNDYSNIPDRDITIKFAPEGEYMMRANALLGDVFHNLVDNAVKHSHGPLMVVVNISRVNHYGRSYYRVAFEDNGRGIPDDKKEEVFDRFKRGQTRARGTGLGLYLVKTLVEGFGGYVEVQNRVLEDYTKGTRFLVYLPVLEENDAGSE